jgi:anti-sigma factor RsiW
MANEPSPKPTASHPDHPSEACLALFRHLSEYIDNELDKSAFQHIEHHLKDCIPCRVCLETLRQTVAACHAMQNESSPIPESASQKLHQALLQYIHETRSCHHR